MRFIIVLLMLVTFTMAKADTYKYMYATKDKAANAELVYSGEVSVALDEDNETIIVSFDSKYALFKILGLKKYTEDEVSFSVVSGKDSPTLFSFYPSYVLFRYKGMNFILIDIPKKMW